MTPDKYTNQELFVEAGDGHELYVHDWGNAQAKQVIFFLHGGPGSGCNDGHKQQFDPQRQRVIFHDQRGAGRSLPYGTLDHNTTDKLVADISRIADKLKIKSFILTGGSWGSTLALAYGIAHPERVRAMVLDGIFTGSQEEISWLDQGRFRTFYPDAWQHYLEQTPPAHHDDPSAYHFKRLLGDDEQAAKASGLAYQTLEVAVMKLDDRFAAEKLEDFDHHSIRLEAFYMHNRCFMPDKHILDNANKLTMPVWLVQGRYDMVCPPAGAYRLHQTLPQSELIFTTSGHARERESWNLKRTILIQLTA
jgi:proline iminopeptidase